MASTFNAKLATYGQWTYRVAWALEIVAASIGLATGIALGYQAFSHSADTDLSISTLDLALASAPFVMVALAELIKIPVATLLFSVSWMWKPVLAVCLALMAMITFETVVLGLERASAQRQVKYEDIQRRQNALKSERTNLEQMVERNGAASSAQVTEAQAELERVDSLATAAAQRKQVELDRLQKEIDNLNSRNPQSNPEYAALERRIRAKDAELNDKIAKRDNDIAQQVGQFERQRDSYDRRIAEARAAGDMAAVKRYEDERARLRNPVPDIRQKYAADLQRLEDELRPLRQQISDIERVESEADKQTRTALESRRAQLEQERRATQQEWDERRRAALPWLERAQREQVQSGQDATQLRTRISELGVAIGNAEKERVLAAKTDQVRRLAAKWYGKEPENVGTEEASFVGLIWFGSLTGLAAFAGPLTAIVALGLQRSAEMRETRDPRSLSAFLRRWLIRWRFRRTRKVPYPVEVPVEKEVEKKILVPYEKVIKEILYVPILTDDPEAVRSALAKDLPTEISDLVRMKFKDGSHASSAQHRAA